MQLRLHDYVMKKLEKTQLTLRQVADGSGVPWRTLQKIASGEIKNPGVSHCEDLAAFFSALNKLKRGTQQERFDALMLARRAKTTSIDMRTVVS